MWTKTLNVSLIPIFNSVVTETRVSAAKSLIWDESSRSDSARLSLTAGLMRSASPCQSVISVLLTGERTGQTYSEGSDGGCQCDRSEINMVQIFFHFSVNFTVLPLKAAISTAPKANSDILE